MWSIKTNHCTNIRNKLARADFDLMYGIAEFLWGAVLGERSAAWYSKQATNNDAMGPKETQRPIIFNSMGLPPNAAPASLRSLLRQ